LVKIHHSYSVQGSGNQYPPYILGFMDSGGQIWLGFLDPWQWTLFHSFRAMGGKFTNVFSILGRGDRNILRVL